MRMRRAWQRDPEPVQWPRLLPCCGSCPPAAHPSPRLLPPCPCSYDQLCSECDARKVLCTQCISNYFKDGDGFCTKCADPLCKRCGPSAATCKKCTAADFNLDKNPLVYKDSRGRCRHCAFSIHGSCKACNSTGTCARCASGHYMDAAGSCKRCPDPLCVRCTGPKGKTCVKCETGFYEEDDFEQPSYPVYLTATGSCAKCTKQPWYKGCRACKEGGACTRCEEGFRLSSKGTCNPCADDRCAECAPNLIKCLKVRAAMAAGGAGLQSACVSCFIQQHAALLLCSAWMFPSGQRIRTSTVQST